jgi:large subunit ribosomal protein L10
MNRDEKAAVVKEISTSLKDAGSVFAFDYRGISVAEGAELRTQLREADTTFKVVKNRLAKRALSETDSELEELLSGPTAIAFVNGDPVVAAKALATFAREHGVPTYKGGLMDGDPLDAESFSAIALLPAIDVLYGQLVSMVASPVTSLARGLSQLIGGLAQQLNQIAEQGLVTGTPPEPATPEPQADTGPAAPEGEVTEVDEASKTVAPGGEAEEATGNEKENES